MWKACPRKGFAIFKVNQEPGMARAGKCLSENIKNLLVSKKDWRLLEEKNKDT